MIKHIIHVSLLTLLALLVASCGPDDKHFRIKGKLLNFNQGEFLVYSPDGALASIDTIDIVGGRFTFEPRCLHEGTAVILISDKQELPVFVSPGASYSIDGDAQNMKEVKVKGSKDNELMGEFRKLIAEKRDSYVPEKEIDDFVKAHPTSPVCSYLIRRYLLSSKTPDYGKAIALLSVMLKAQPDNTQLQVFHSQINELKNTSAGNMLPSFSVKDMKGNTMTNKDVSTGITIFVSHSSWDYESTSQLNRILGIKRELQRNWKIVVVSFDAEKHVVNTYVRMDDSEGCVVCDGNMSENELAKKLAISQTGVVIITQNGKIRERNLSGEDLYKELRTY